MRVHLVAIGLLTIYAVVAALVVAVTSAWPLSTTSLRTRSFVVIALAVLVPCLCLSALGVWSYYRSWQTAATLYADQATYNARELKAEIASTNDVSTRARPTRGY